MFTVAVDCSLLTSHNPHRVPGVWTYVTDDGVEKWGTTDLVHSGLIELLAVNKVLEDFPDRDICIHCDVVGVQTGSKRLFTSRYKKKEDTIFRLTGASLWKDFDRLAKDRNILVVPPPIKNKDLHGQAHRLARRMVCNDPKAFQDVVIVLCDL